MSCLTVKGEGWFLKCSIFVSCKGYIREYKYTECIFTKDYIFRIVGGWEKN